MRTNAKAKATMLVVFGLLLLLAILVGRPALHKALIRARTAEVLSNGLPLKLVMDSFAMDNGGAYPCADTAEFHGTPDVTNSNAAFQQLFASNNTNSEAIFWVEGARVCGARPDNVTSTNGSFDSSLTLQAGDNGWSLYPDRINTANPDLPLHVTAFLPGTPDLDPDVFSGRAIVYHIGGFASIINTDGSTPSGSLPDIGRGAPARPNTSAILTDLETILHPIPAKP